MVESAVVNLGFPTLLPSPELISRATRGGVDPDQQISYYPADARSTRLFRE